MKDMSYTSHVGKYLREADFSGTDLRRAIFDGAVMRGASFIKAKMNLSNFQGCRLEDADLRGIRGRYAIWRNAIWCDAKMNDDLREVLTKKWPRE